MCSLQKLSVQGIRSFSPDQPQVIKFYPLTVILGPNGTGKTTLIECLRYASSGETPPNTNKGKTWVHDPQLSNRSHTVHAQVKLKFTDASKDKVETVVARPLELQLTRDKQDKISSRIRTLGAAIKRGDKTYANAKCVDVEMEMLTLLGVSKAVLTNVIFCHQEESNWPLSDGKVLKEKFDAIFGSMGYVKALQKIKNLRKERLTEQKSKQHELMLYFEQKERHEKNEREYQEQTKELAKLKHTVRKVDEKLSPLQQKLADIEIKERSFSDFESKIAKMKGHLDEQKLQSETSKSLCETFDGTREQLQEKIKNFKENLERKRREESQIANELIGIDKRIRVLTEEKNELFQLKGKFDLIKEQYSSNIRRRQELIEEIIHKESIKEDTWNSSKKEFNINLIMEYLRRKVNHLNIESEASLNSLDAIITDTQSKLEKQKRERYGFDLSITNLERIINAKKSEKQSLDEELSATNFSGAKLNRIRSEIKVKFFEYDSLKNSTNVDAFNDSISNLTLKKSTAKAELENLNSSLTRMQSEYAIRAEINLLEKNKVKEEENLSEIFENNAFLMKRFNVTKCRTETSVYKKLNTLLLKLNTESDNLKNELGTLEKEKSKYEALYKVENKKYVDLANELNEKAKIIQDICGKKYFDDFFAAVKQEDKILREKYSSLQNCKFIWNDIINDIQKERQCVVCCRDFNDEQQINSTITNIQKRLESCPDAKKSLEKDMKMKNDLLEKLHSLRSTNERINALPKLIDNSKATVEDLSEKLSGLRYSIEARNETFIEKCREIETLKKFDKSAVEYDISLQEINGIESKIETLTRRLSNDTNGVKSIDDMRDEIEKKNEEIISYEKDIERINRKKNEYYEKLNILQRDINELESELLKVEKDQQSKVNMEKKKSELIDEITKSEEKIKQLKENAVLNQKIIEDLESKLSPVIKSRKDEEERYRLIADEIHYFYKEIENLNRLIESYVKDGEEEKLSQLQHNQKQLEEQLTKLDEKKVSYSKLKESILLEISKSETNERNLKENARLFDILDNIKELETLIKVEEAKFGSADISTLRREKRQISDEISSQKSEKDRALSLQTPVLTRMRALEDEMNLEKYKKASENFRKKQLEVMAESIICDDLDKYYKALDHSVMTFHQKKMEDINKLVFKLWKQTYRGGDIEYIKIVFDENEERSASDRKRNFNYRVVMVKEGGVELDMRGRCSAGQKVLASLVIRLALAEIFCINCGVLALDEPTTNLDQENIQSFANAVTEIVKSHKKLNNFQMIIITHDEQFLKCLDEESDEYYYRVFKENGFSKIKECSLKERD